MMPITLAATLFIIGLCLRTVAENDGYPVFRKVAWVLWCIAGLLWYFTTYGDQLHIGKL